MISPVKIWRNQKKLQQLVHTTGTVVSWTFVRVASSEWKEYAPYPVAVVELDNKKKVICKMVDYKKRHLAIGQRVITVVRRIRKPSREGIIPYGIKVKPVE